MHIERSDDDRNRAVGFDLSQRRTQGGISTQYVIDNRHPLAEQRWLVPGGSRDFGPSVK